MSALVLKLIAAVSMLVDHAGLMLFPKAVVLRYIGRLAFPIYAFFIAEGFRYTHSRVKYFLRVFLLGLACQIVYSVAERQIYIGILLTFSMSICIMAAISLLRSNVRRSDEVVLNKYSRPIVIVLASLLCVFAVGAAYFICEHITVDYGFFGVMLPVLVSLSDKKSVRLVLFTLGCVLVTLESGGVFSVLDKKWLILQSFSLLTVPLIALYNGERGKYKLKYFFYIFYPAHLAVLYLISLII